MDDVPKAKFGWDGRAKAQQSEREKVLSHRDCDLPKFFGPVVT